MWTKATTPPELYSDSWRSNSEQILMTDGIHTYTGYCWKYPDEETINWTISGRDGYSFNEITHWMPLPELPKD